VLPVHVSQAHASISSSEAGEVESKIQLGRLTRKSHQLRHAPGQSAPYLAQRYANGDECSNAAGTSTQLNERTTEVRYFCCEDSQANPPTANPNPLEPRVSRIGNSYIVSVSEVLTCSYIIQVCSQYACPADGEVAAEVTNQEPTGARDRFSAKVRTAADDLGTKKRTDSDIDADIGAADVAQMKSLSTSELEGFRTGVRDMFYRGYDAYMKHAFPLDELQPLSCAGENFKLTAGKLLTLIDSLDTLVVLGNRTEFARAVKLVSERVDFDLDKTVSVFETTIRVLGGLISAYIFASDEGYGFAIPGYKDELLHHAVDLADRLLPALDTSTSIPYVSARTACVMCCVTCDNR
jgi:hypothetical protein